jgi:hypothetical protein
MNKTNEKITELYAAPSRIQHEILQGMESQIAGGNGVLTPNNVASFLIDSFSTMSSNITKDTIQALDDTFPVRATNSETLYKHMSDFDYIGLFATPSGTNLEFVVAMDSLREAPPVYADDDTAEQYILYRKAIIPRDTIFLIGNYTYSLHYPIEIRFNVNTDTATVVYDTTVTNPIFGLASELLESRIYSVDTVKLLSIKIPTYQFERTYYEEEVFKATPFVKEYPFEDEFYAVRIYTNKVYENYNNSTSIEYMEPSPHSQSTFVDEKGETWTELHQTLSSKIYDVDSEDVPTAIVTVMQETKSIKLAIPFVYMTQDQLGNKLKIEILATKGEVDIDTSPLAGALIPAKFPLTGVESTDKYSSMLTNRNNINIGIIDQRIIGGSVGMDYTNLRRRVIYDTFNDELLITPMDLVGYFEDLNVGMKVSKFKDGITSRIYLCYKELRDVKGAIVPSGDITTLLRTSDIESGNDYKIKNIRRYRDGSFLMTPDVMYLYNKDTDIAKPMSDAEVLLLESKKENPLTQQAFIDDLNNSTYTYNPFYNKVSTINNIPFGETFDLESPEIINRDFVAEAAAEIQLSINNVVINAERMEIVDADAGDRNTSILKYIISVEVKASYAQELPTPLVPTNVAVVASTVNKLNNTVFKNNNDTGVDAVFDENGLYTYDIELETNGWINTPELIQFKFENSVTGFIRLNDDITISLLLNGSIIPTLDGIDNEYLTTSATIGFETLSIYNLNVKFGSTIKELFTAVDISYDQHEFETYPDNINQKYSTDSYLRDTNGSLVLYDPGSGADFIKIKQVGQYMYRPDEDGVSYLEDFEISRTGEIVKITKIDVGEDYYGYIELDNNIVANSLIRAFPRIITLDNYAFNTHVTDFTFALNGGLPEWVSGNFTLTFDTDTWYLKESGVPLTSAPAEANDGGIMVPPKFGWAPFRYPDSEGEPTYTISFKYEATGILDNNGIDLSQFVVLNRSDLSNETPFTGLAVPFASSGNTVTFTLADHFLTTGDTLTVASSTNTDDLPDGEYVSSVIVIDDTTFTIDAGQAGDDTGGAADISISKPVDIDSSQLVRDVILTLGFTGPVTKIVSPPVYESIKGNVKTLSDLTPVQLSRETYYRVYMIHINKRILYGDLNSYANYESTEEYVNSMKQLILDNCGVVATSKPRLIPNTDIYYRPSKSIGKADFKVSSPFITQFDLEFSIHFKLFVVRRVIGDDKILHSIRQTIVKIVDEYTVNNIFALTQIADAITSQLGHFVKSVDTFGLNSNMEDQTLVHVDDGTVLNLKHILVYNSNTGVIEIDRDIGFQFLIVDAEGDL